MAVAGAMLLVLLPQAGWTAAPGAVQPPDACADLESCRTAALEAEAAGDGERFHDLAWRVMQLAPKDDAAAMYVVARAQAASGRSSDALVMLRRLAEAGVATDAADLDVFARVRQREGWPALEALARTATRRLVATGLDAAAIEPSTAASGGAAAGTAARAATDPDAGATRGDSVGSPTSGAAATSSAAGVATVAPAVPPRPAYGSALVADVALRLETGLDGLDGGDGATGGFAYDAVSGRYLVGDRDGRKIVVVDEPSRRVADLVRGDSAGFRQLVAMEIDTRRGDLWVLSNDPAVAGETRATVHKVQLIAGRPLARIEPPADAGSVRFTDLAVTASGAVLVIDAAGQRLFRIDPRATTLTPVMTLDVPSPAAVTIAGSDEVAYVAHGNGVSRLDMARRRLAPVVSAVAEGTSISDVWWHDGGLVVMCVEPTGARSLQRWQLDRQGVTVQEIRTVDISLPETPTPVAVTLSGSSLLVLTGQEGQPASAGSGDAAAEGPVVRRVRLGP